MTGLSRRERERQARQEEIVRAAEKLFSEKGFESTSVDEIARAAEFTKRTVYQYFINKEDLFYAVILKGMRQLIAYLHAAAESKGTGFEKTRRMKEAAYRCMRDFPDVFRLMNYIRHMPPSEAKSPSQIEIARLNGEMFSEFRKVLTEGMRDGSIRSDFDTEKEMFALFFVITGAVNRLFEVGGRYAALFSLDEAELAQTMFDLIDRIIKPEA